MPTKKECIQCCTLLVRSPSQFCGVVFCSKECKKVWTFWQGVDIKTSDECWVWKRGKSKNGYGTWTSKNSYVHRYAYEITFGPLKNLACHKCNNRLCCNPLHIYDGTYKDNTMDAIIAGTKYSWGKNVPSPTMRKQ